ncbi:MAG: hypothetical protein M3446_06270 [Actinomycetota bacterium]|nr:hypothetical protein [Geodermatophilaceae bacterium]MDQ3505293.1 hypothetical protein [Actinomycetota bacterium]
MRKFLFVLGLSVGYVLGARAGRQRYEQLLGSWRHVRDNPAVQEAAGLVQARAENVVGAVKSRIGSETSDPRASSAYTGRLNGSQH